MKNDTHPKEYRYVVFRDTSNSEAFITRSCVNTKETTTWEDGKVYPLHLMGISSSSHPFFTGQQKFLDTAGCVDRFQQRQAKTQALQATRTIVKPKKK